MTSARACSAIEANRLYALWHLVSHYGLRRSEVCNLAWEDVDLATRTLHVRDDVKSEDSDRMFRLDPATAEVLRNWKGRQLLESAEWGDGWTDWGRVFTREDGRPLRDEWLLDRVKSLGKKAGLPPITFHGLRHGAATMLRAAKVDLKTVSEMLGHATVQFTSDVYGTIAEEMYDDAASRIAAFLATSPDGVINGSYSEDESG
ncbi:MAG: tyrosine-type recombinase/integrase [Streptosporangiaceae bacterium]